MCYSPSPVLQKQIQPPKQLISLCIFVHETLPHALTHAVLMNQRSNLKFNRQKSVYVFFGLVPSKYIPYNIKDYLDWQRKNMDRRKERLVIYLKHQCFMNNSQYNWHSSYQPFLVELTFSMYSEIVIEPLVTYLHLQCPQELAYYSDYPIVSLRT